MTKSFFVYIMSNRPGGVLYVGVTSDLVSRAHQHRTGAVEGFTKRYHLHSLVWYEPHGSAESAIRREKRLKKWPRSWKMELIRGLNPQWRDLWPDIVR
jgi:putative endonuclease